MDYTINMEEMNKLKAMLMEANIPYSLDDTLPFVGEKIMLRINESKYIDAVVIPHYLRDDNDERDLLEIMGGLTLNELKENQVLGGLTAEEVFERFEYCYRKGTDVYEQQR